MITSATAAPGRDGRHSLVSPPVESIIEHLAAGDELRRRADAAAGGLVLPVGLAAPLLLEAADIDVAVVAWLVAHIPPELLQAALHRLGAAA